MNEILSVEKYVGKQEFSIEKSAYRSIIYCFSGSVTLNDGAKSIEAGKNQFVLPKNDKRYIFKQSDASIVYLVTIEDGALSTAETFKGDDDEGFPIGFFIEEAYKRYEGDYVKKEIYLNALGSAISAYVSAKVGKSSSDGFCEVISAEIQSNVSNADFKTSEFISTLPISCDYAKKVYKKKTGRTPNEYLTKLRLDKARMILSGTDRFNYTVKKVAALCGYKDALYFSRLFKERFSYSPSDYAHRFDKPNKTKKMPVGGVVENIADDDDNS